MNHDDPKLTAYALGEVDEAIELDDSSARIVEETALIASVLREHYRKPLRSRRVMRYAMAAAVMLVGFAIFVMSNRTRQHPAVVIAPTQQPEAKAQAPAAPILRLAPMVAEASDFTALTSANFRGIPALDVERLVSVVIEDASRVGDFTSLRLAPAVESDVMFQ